MPVARRGTVCVSLGRAAREGRDGAAIDWSGRWASNSERAFLSLPSYSFSFAAWPRPSPPYAHARTPHSPTMASGGLFRKFSRDDVSTQNNVKSSVQRAIRGKREEGERRRSGAECSFRARAQPWRACPRIPAFNAHSDRLPCPIERAGADGRTAAGTRPAAMDTVPTHSQPTPPHTWKRTHSSRPVLPPPFITQPKSANSTPPWRRRARSRPSSPKNRLAPWPNGE